MKGLLLKDLLNLKKQGKMYLILVGFYLVFSIAMNNTSFFGGMVCILSAMLPVTALSYDERAKWDKFALTMPVSRRDMVTSKYVLGLSFSLLGVIIFFLCNLLTKVELSLNLTTSLVFLGLGILVLSLTLPILFKFGVEKGRILMMLIFFVPAGIIMLLPNLGLSFTRPSENLLKMLTYAAPVALIAIALISIMVSIRIYQRKEI
ncbi:ABC-2 transporter permease [Paenibacillus sp. FSL K6-0276]|uniref:ABC-2 transporter permease n=2 Tax=unclassified Paenibacillus TaxID=185978 RepID=UPI0030EED5EE